jgi:hypothetical protein
MEPQSKKTCIDCNKELDIGNFYTANGKPHSCCKQCFKRRIWGTFQRRRKRPIILAKDTERYNEVKDEFMYFVDASENPILNLKATHLWIPKPAPPEHPPLTLGNCLFGSEKKARWCCIICDREWIASIKSRFRITRRVIDRGRTRGYKITKPSGCPKCKGGVKMTREEWIQKFNNAHNNLYDYSLVGEIKNSWDTIPIICPKDGKFEQQVIVHSTGHGCTTCMGRQIGNMKRLSLTEVIGKCKSAHKNCPAESLCHRYDYSKVNYKNNHTHIDVGCPKHGMFQQNPKNHWKSEEHGGPAHCYSCMNKGWSKMAIEYIKIMEKVYNCKFKTAVNGGEYRMQNGKYLDAIDKERKIIIEFHGCPWHGCLLCFPDKEQIICETSIDQRYINTLKKDKYIKENFPDYKYITMWSHEYLNFKKIKKGLMRFHPAN